jgi:hypothetical protein
MHPGDVITGDYDGVSSPGERTWPPRSNHATYGEEVVIEYFARYHAGEIPIDIRGHWPMFRAKCLTVETHP